MHNRRSVWFGMILLGLAWCSGGCVDGVRLGFQGGIEDAIAAAIETVVSNALAPITETE